MVNRQKLTEKVLREAIPAEGRDYQIFDTDVRGFAVCIYRGGGRAFTLDYRHAGRQRRMTFGRWPEWGVTAARERAKELRREIDAGGDPLATRGALREAPRVTDLIARYVEVHLPHLAALNAADQRSMMEKFIGPAWGRMLVTEVSSYDVELLLTKVAEGRARPAKQKPNNRARKLQGAKPTPVRANRVGDGQIEITYTSARNPEPRTKRVEPHGVIVGTRHYLVARDGSDDRQFKQYRLDRISKIQGTATLFARDPDFDIETYSTFAFGSYFSEEEHGLVRWRFTPRAATVAREFVFHPTQVLTDMPDGSLIVEFTASGWVEMAWHLIIWGNDVEVLDPPELTTVLDEVRRGEVKVLP